MKRFFIILLIILLLPAFSLSQDKDSGKDKGKSREFQIEDDFSDDFEDFENKGEKSGKEEAVPPVKNSFFRFGGYFKIHTSYNFAHESTSEHEGLSALKGEVMLETEAKISGNWKFYINGSAFYNSAYSINGRDEYEETYLDDYEDDGELKEAYISGSLTGWMDIKAGRQIVVWGKSDYIRVTDILNPLNLQEPGLTDIKDLRLPVAMSRLGFFFSDFSLYAIAVHEHRYNKLPSYGSDFYTLNYNLPDEEIPPDTFRNNEYALSLEGHFTGWDLSFYYFDGFDDSFFVDGTTKKHNRIKMFGSAVNIASGNVLYKAEAAFYEGLRYTGTSNEYSRSDIFAGFEYSGFKDTTLGFETVCRYITDHDDVLETAGQDDNLVQSVLFIKRDFMNETLSITLIASTFGDGSDGAYQRFTLEYDITDNLKIYTGVIFYKSGDYQLLKNADDNDRAFMDLTYTF